MDFGVPAAQRVATVYAQALLSQDLDSIGVQLSINCELEGIQYATGRLQVLRALHDVFKWYHPSELKIFVVEKQKTADRAQVMWSKAGCEISDTLVLSPQTNQQYGQPPRIERIVRETETGSPDSQQQQLGQQQQLQQQQRARAQMPPSWHQLMSIIAAGQAASAAASPRDRSASPRSGSGTPRTRIETVNPSAELPILDFSFREITSMDDLLKTEPRQGQRVRPQVPGRKEAQTEAAKAAAAKAKAAAEKLRQEEEEALVLVKAKNKKGDEAAYQWDRAEMKSIMEVVQEEQEVNADGKETVRIQAAGQGPDRFRTQAVRVSNNQLTEVPEIARVLKALVHYSMLRLTWLDLSCNAISVIPNDLDEFPVQVLYLHSNNIQSFNEVKKLCKVRTLHSLTLWNNPIENKMTQPGQYKIHCLHLLTSSDPSEAERSPRLRKLDHVVISRQDLKNCRMYREMTVHAQERRHQRRLAPTA